jgi:hypothetical protein
MPTTTRRGQSGNDKSAKVCLQTVRVRDNATITLDVNNENSKENEREPESFNSMASSGFQMRQMQNGQMVRICLKQVFTEPWY